MWPGVGVATVSLAWVARAFPNLEAIAVSVMIALFEHYPRDPDPAIRKTATRGQHVSYVYCIFNKRDGLWVWVSFIVLI